MLFSQNSIFADGVHDIFVTTKPITFKFGLHVQQTLLYRLMNQNIDKLHIFLIHKNNE